MNPSCSNNPQMTPSHASTCSSATSGSSPVQQIDLDSSDNVYHWEDYERPLRPIVPNAPYNSNQFLMDNIETSPSFVSFDEQGSGNPPIYLGEDFPYSLADFQRMYQNARIENFASMSSDELKKKILALQLKKSSLHDHLNALPSKIIERLQGQLLDLQKEHKKLKNKNEQLKKKWASQISKSSASSCSSSSSSSSSNSESHSSESSSECEQMSTNEDEKENTQPSSQS